MRRRTVLFLEPKGTIFEVVKAAVTRGLEVIAISSDLSFISNPPQAYQASAALLKRVERISGWTDFPQLERIYETLSKEFQIAGIYSGVDPCASSCSELRTRIGLPTSNPRNVTLVLDKDRLRNALRNARLSTLKSCSAAEVESWSKWKFKGAAYFKPLHGFFSAYVQRCESLRDYQKAKKAWESGVGNEKPFIRNYLESNPGYYLEEAIEGELLSVESISIQGRFHAFGLLSRILFSKNSVVEMGSCFPYPHPAAERIINKVKLAHEVLGLTDGPSHTEVIVDATGNVEIIDLNPRFVGADVLQSINFAYGIQVEDILLNYALGIQPILSKTQKQFSCLQYVLPPEITEFQSIDFPVNDAVRFATSFLKPGTKISSFEKQLDYLGCYLTVMPSFNEAVALSNKLRAQVRVNGSLQGAY